MTWADIIRLVDEHPRLAANQFRVDAARQGSDAAGAIPNPTLEGNLGRGFTRTGNASRLEWGLALTMPLSFIAQRGPQKNVAIAEVDVARAESAALRRDMLLQLQTLYWELAYAQASVASLQTLEAQTAALVKTVQTRVEKGESRPVEAMRVEIELEKVASELETARTSLSTRQTKLALWLRVPEDKSLVVSADLNTLPTTIEREVALASARKTHPVLQVSRARNQALEAEVTRERRARIPTVNLTGFATSELDRTAYGIGLAVDVPLWNWNSENIAQAEFRLAAGRKEAEASSLELEATVVEATANCRSSLATTLRFRDNILPRSETTAATTEKTYQIGEASLLEVIDARRTLLDSRRLYLSALVQAQIDCSRLQALVGKESL